MASGLTPDQVANLAAGFQESVVDVLVRKTIDAAERYDAGSIGVVGGVAANRALRDRFASSSPLPLHISPPDYSTDNAAMIAGAAYYVRPPAGPVDVMPALSLATTEAK